LIVALFFFAEACSLPFGRSSHPRLLALYCIIKEGMRASFVCVHYITLNKVLISMMV